MEALPKAASRGDRETVEALIKTGVDVNAQGGEYGNALQAAANQGNKEVVEILIKAGILKVLLKNQASADIQSSKNSSGQTPFHLAATSGDLQLLEMLDPLLDSNSILNEKDIDGRTPLHLAVEEKAVDVTKWLLSKGAEVNIRDFGDVTPFQQASQLENFEILCLLFPKITEDLNLINASKWRSILGHGSDKTIMITNGESATIKAISKRELDQYIDDRSYSLAPSTLELPAKDKSMAKDTLEKLILLFGNGSSSGLQYRWWRKTTKTEGKEGSRRDTRQIWRVHLNTVPSAVIISQLPSGECFLECRFTLPIFHSTNQENILESLIKPLENLKRKHGIIWIMVKPESSKTEMGSLKAGPEAKRPILKSKTFFSTLEYATVPNTATDLFLPLIQQLREEWDGISKEAGQHLNDMARISIFFKDLS
ncbi:MAG: Ankyrin-1 [Cirrosporium novae-zelandiae]|nr:MAG: Ankyrin-1 [Cirrosporium novae-zelandiae]